MSIFARILALAFVLASFCLGGQTGHAQTAPVSYWIPGWPLGFGGNPAGGQSANTYGNFPSFDGHDARGDFSYTRYNFPNGWFVGGEGGSIGLGLNGNPDGAFGTSLHYEGAQFGYNFQGGLPVTVYAGFDTLKYNTGIGNLVAPFDNVSSTVPGYSAHAGIEFKPTSNLSLSLGVGFTQQPGAATSLH